MKTDFVVWKNAAVNIDEISFIDIEKMVNDRFCLQAHLKDSTRIILDTDDSREQCQEKLKELGKQLV